jgi:hypothetical protein
LQSTTDPRGKAAHHCYMPCPTHAEAEERIRRLLVDNGLPRPDGVVRRPAELVLLYHEQKLAFVFELDDSNPAEA